MPNHSLAGPVQAIQAAYDMPQMDYIGAESTQTITSATREKTDRVLSSSESEMHLETEESRQKAASTRLRRARSRCRTLPRLPMSQRCQALKHGLKTASVT